MSPSVRARAGDGPSRQLRGLAAAPGIAIGPVWRYRGSEATADALTDVRAAAARAAVELEELAERVRGLGRPDEAGILEAQAVMAGDPAIVDAAAATVTTLGLADPGAIAAAVETAAGLVADSIAALPDERLATRAVDVRDVGARIARIVAGRRFLLPERPSIAIAADLPPSVAAELPAGLLLGIALEGGSPVSHAAILARGLGIPAVVAVPGLVAATDMAASRIRGPKGGEGVPVIALDGATGSVVIGPDAADRDRLAAEGARRSAEATRGRQLRGHPGATADGRLVRLAANIGRPEDCARALEVGAEGVGLFRTEFLFVGRASPPSESEQVAAYRRAFDAFGPARHVVVRLADIGGDKSVPYLGLPSEANPFLGVRGIRLAREERGLFVTQIRAIARAGDEAGVTPHLMAPMVATLEDVTLTHELVAEALEGLDAAGVARAERLAVGVMIEVPSAAFMAAELARRVDFFSVGSNDLTQYVLALDRTNARLATAADALHPAVLRAIRATVEGASAAAIPVAVCGELASDPAGALVLVGLGIAELSMDAGAIDAVRTALARASSRALEHLATAALRLETAADVRAAASELLSPAPG